MYKGQNQEGGAGGLKDNGVTVQAVLDGATFRRFAMFDVFCHQKRWRSPALFALILGAAAAICFVLHERRGAVLLGSVLLAVALGLPAAYFLSYFLSVRAQAKKLDAGGGTAAYTVRLDGDGVRVTQGESAAEFSWVELLCAYRVEGCVYLYAAPRRAFLLPERCGGGGAWRMLQRHMAQERVFDRCGGAA